MTDELRPEYEEGFWKEGVRGKYAKMEILRSNEPLPILLHLPTVFLAGPTNRDDTPTAWRVEAIQHFKELGFDGSLYVPEPFAENFDKQVAWERNGLMNASFVLFWVPRSIGDKVLALTTNIEFGRYVNQSSRIIYGRPDWADNVRYLDWLYKEETGDEPVNDLRKLIEKTLERIPSRWD